MSSVFTSYYETLDSLKTITNIHKEIDMRNLVDDTRKAEITNYLKKGMKVCERSTRTEDRIWSHLDNPAYAIAAWTRKVWEQNYKGQLSQAVQISLSTDLVVSEEFFLHLLDQCGVPPTITHLSASTKEDRVKRMGSINQLLSSFTRGKRLEESQEKKSEPDIEEMYTCEAKISDTSPVRNEVNNIGEQRITDPTMPYDQIVYDSVGISYKPGKKDFNIEIKFYLQKSGEGAPEQSDFHTGPHPKRSTSINIHITNGLARQNYLCHQSIDSFEIAISERLIAFSKCFFKYEYLTLIHLEDFFYDPTGKAVAYTYGVRDGNQAIYRMCPLKINKASPANQAPTDSKEQKGVPDLGDNKGFPALPQSDATLWDSRARTGSNRNVTDTTDSCSAPSLSSG